jgi:uncharacterized damage-inducible protein DinB
VAPAPSTECEEKEHLLRAYSFAASDYSRAVEVLHLRLGVMSKQEYDKVRKYARETIPAVIARLNGGSLDEIQREEISGRQLSTHQYLVHAYGHLSYHLGQIDYLRRISGTGQPIAFVDLIQANWHAANGGANR